MPDQKIRVSFYHRKPRNVGNYSVEFIFKDVRERLKNLVDSIPVYSRYESSGLFKRLYNCWEALFKQSQVNHITGDINYIGILLRKKQTIQTILDCVHLENSSGLKHIVLKLFWVSLPVKRCRYVTAISESTKKEILKYTDCDPGKIIVIPVAISVLFKKKERSFNKTKPTILQLGAAPNKNIPRLIEALQNISCTLNIVGKQNEEYEKMLKEYQIDYIYEWDLSDLEILKRYEDADIIALVSTYEGFGMPILEGQATGRPVITSNILSMPEVAGDAACLVDPNDVHAIRANIKKIIEDDNYRNSLVEKGFRNIERFNPDKIAGMYYELYNEIAKTV